MKKLLVVMTVLVACACTLSADPLPCGSGASTFAALNLQGGCIDGDKLYSNFWYLIDGEVGGNLGEIQAVFQDLAVIYTHTVTVNPIDQVGGTLWTSPVAFGYDVTVLPLAGPCAAGGCYWGLVGGAVSGTLSSIGSAQIVKTFLVGDNTVLVLNSDGGRVSGPLSAASLHVGVAVNPSSGGVVNVTDQYIQGELPEPATMALFGSGLLAFGLIRRFRR